MVITVLIFLLFPPFFDGFVYLSIVDLVGCQSGGLSVSRVTGLLDVPSNLSLRRMTMDLIQTILQYSLPHIIRKAELQGWIICKTELFLRDDSSRYIKRITTFEVTT